MKPREYEFTNAKGQKFYEIVYDSTDVFAFCRLHNAVEAKPVKEK